MDERVVREGKKTVMPKRRGQAFRILFVCAAAGLAALGCLCWQLLEQRQAGAEREAALFLRLEKQMEEMDQLQSSLDERQAALDEARETIGYLEKYTLLTPEGDTPEYMDLYPDMYAQPWTGKEITGDKTVCLTFDDGPSSNTSQLLDILDQYDVKATFFVVGKTSCTNQQRMRDIVAAGHTLGIHSWSHEFKTIYSSVEAYLDDFHELYEWIYEVTGEYPQVFRFPGGSINGYNRGIYQEIISEMTRRGFVYFDWNASAEDATATLLSSSEVSRNCLKGIGRDLVVVLAHDSAARTTTVSALPKVIEGYRDAGYSFEPLTPGVKPVIFGYKLEE